jgi:hypothetical protein
MKFDGNDVVTMIGLALLFTGLWWWWPAAALIAVGAIITVVGIFGAWGRGGPA